VAIDPVAVLKVVGDEAVDCLEGGKDGEEISVVFVCRCDVVRGCVMAGLAVAVVGLPRVLKGVSGRRGGSGREVPG